jgi:hypothetical protein
LAHGIRLDRRYNYRARVTGDIPESTERRLVVEQRIGEAEGSDSVTFGRIEYIAVRTDNSAFVLDQQGPTIKLFDSTGRLLRFVGRKGGGPGEYEYVNGMDILPNAHLVLWDASHARINRYDANGEFVASWRAPVTGMFTSDGLATDRDAAIVLTAPIAAAGVFGESGYIRFDTAGVLRDTIRVPRWVDSTPQITAVRDGGSMRASVALPFARGLIKSWSALGALLSGASDPYVVYVMRTGTKPLRIEGRHDQVRVIAGEADEARERVTWSMRLSAPDWTWDGPAIPSYKPAYQSLMSGYDGRIWVQLHWTGEELARPDSSRRGPSGLPPPPPRRYLEPNVWDVFEPDGRYLGRVRLAPSQHILRMRGDHVWGVLTDSLDVAYVARWRIVPPFHSPKTP